MRGFILIAVFDLTVCLSSPVLADVQPAKTITVVATGSVDYVPDIGAVLVGVNSEMSTPAAASDDVAAQGTKVLAALRSLGVADKNIKTTQYLTAVQRPDQFGSARPTTYEATEDFLVSEIPVGQLGTVIAAAVQAGASQVGLGPILRSTKLDALHDEALTKAVDIARAEAGKIAARTGVRLGPLYSLDVMDSYQPSNSYPGAGMQVLGHVTTRATPSIASGTDTVTVTVQAVYEIR